MSTEGISTEGQEALHCSSNIVSKKNNKHCACGVRGGSISALLIVFTASAGLSACSTTEELDDDSLKYELCLEADAGNMDCPG